MVSGGMKCIKYLLFVFNLFFFLAGLSLIVIGGLVQTKYNEYFAFFGSNVNGAAILLCAVGIIVFTVGFFGCCGAYKENHCMVVAFAVLLGLVFVLELAAAITAYVMRSDLENLIRHQTTLALRNYEVKGVREAWGQVQQELKCCGAINNYTDWTQNDQFANTSSVPDTCCITVATSCGTGKLNPSADTSSIYHDGCVSKLLIWAKENILILGSVAIGLAFIQATDIVLAVFLSRAIQRDYDYDVD